MLNAVYLLAIFLSVVCGLIYVERSSHLSYRLLVLFLIVTFANEIWCFSLKLCGIKTGVYYNIYYYFRFPLLSVIFYSLLKEKLVIASAIKIFLISTVVLLALDIYVYSGFVKLHVIYLLIGATFVIALCLFFFYFTISDEKLNDQKQVPFFLSAAGIFLYFLGVMPSLGSLSFLIRKAGPSIYERIYFSTLMVPKILSILLYSIIAIDVYKQWKQERLSY